MSNKRRHVQDELKRQRTKADLFVMGACSLVMVYVTDSELLALLLLGIFVFVGNNQMRKLWTADWSQKEDGSNRDDQ